MKLEIQFLYWIQTHKCVPVKLVNSTPSPLLLIIRFIGNLLQFPLIFTTR